MMVGKIKDNDDSGLFSRSSMVAVVRTISFHQHIHACILVLNPVCVALGGQWVVLPYSKGFVLGSPQSKLS